jgi:hypothetical protein
MKSGSCSPATVSELQHNNAELHTLNLQLLLLMQVEETALRSSGYSPATVLELQRWCSGVASGNVQQARSQHTNTAVAAIKFIVLHEPNPGLEVVPHRGCQRGRGRPTGWVGHVTIVLWCSCMQQYLVAQPAQQHCSGNDTVCRASQNAPRPEDRL